MSRKDIVRRESKCSTCSKQESVSKKMESVRVAPIVEGDRVSVKGR